MHNFHLPLPDDLYQQLRSEAKRSQCPATELAREAIAWMLKEKQRQALYEAITQYASENAGSECDLDEALQEASLEYIGEEKS